jgi:CRP-like cAMP-binding protein
MSERMRFVNPLETVLYLKSLPVLRGLGYGELGLLARQAHERHFRKGARLIDPERSIDSFYIVVEGRVRVERDGRLQMICGPGDNVGILHLLARIHRGVEALAEADTLVLELQSRALFEIYEDHFSILQNTIRNLGRTLLRILRDTSPGTYKVAGDLDPLPDRPLDLVERIDRFRRNEIFRRVSFDALAKVAMSMREMRFEADTVLWRRGDPSGTLLILLSGEVLCTLDEDRGTFRAGSGYPLGNVESLAQRPRWYDARTLDRVVALEGETETFLDTLEDHFDLAMEFLQASASNLLRYMDARAAAPEPLVRETS